MCKRSLMAEEIDELHQLVEGNSPSLDQGLEDAANPILDENAVEMPESSNVVVSDDLLEQINSSPEQNFSDNSTEVIEEPSLNREKAAEVDFQAEIDKLFITRQSLAEEAVLLSEQEKTQHISTQALHHWVSEQKESFLWKVLNRMNMNKAEVQGSLDGYQDFIGKLEIPAPGALATIRKRFHKRLMINWLLVLAIGLLFFYLPKISENYPQFSELSRFVNSESFPNRWQLFFIVISLFLITVISLLIQYYRDWSKFERNVTVSLWKLKEISKSVQHYREEQARLQVLYPQVRDWLEILGHALHKPWEIDEKWLISSMNDIHQDEYPFALRIAQAQENDVASAKEIRRKTAERYLTRGWRSKVFEDQVIAAGELMGMDKDRLNVEILDADIALSPGGPRAIVREKIKTAELLKSVAKKQLIPLMKIVQIEAIPESRPRVREYRSDILEAFKSADFDLEMNNLLAWDEFLSISMGDSNKPRTPISPLAFSESGIQVGHHDRAKTIFIAPNRLLSKVPGNETTFADSYGESTRLPLDIVVRMDITGPLQQEDILILKRSDEEKQTARSSYEKAIKDKVQDYKRGV